MMKPAILIVGPTGSGKTPLGDAIAAKGIGDFSMAHFDFGQRLRGVITGTDNWGLSETDAQFLTGVLKSGALLENETFYLAEQIIAYFLETDAHSVDGVVLNGLPRHVGQAEDISRFFDVSAVVHLNCSPQTVLARIQRNSGGDRTHRTDDDVSLVTRKLAIFNERTLPLIEHYRLSGASIVELDVQEDTSSQDLLPLMPSLRIGS